MRQLILSLISCVTVAGLTPSFGQVFGHSAESLNSLLRISTQAFKQDTWTAFNGSSRQGMVADLVRTEPLIGMTRSQVHELLGAPSAASDNRILLLAASDDAYPLNHMRCASSTAFYLAILYDKGEVKSLEVRSMDMWIMPEPPTEELKLRHMAVSPWWIERSDSVTSNQKVGEHCG